MLKYFDKKKHIIAKKKLKSSLCTSMSSEWSHSQHPGPAKGHKACSRIETTVHPQSVCSRSSNTLCPEDTVVSQYSPTSLASTEDATTGHLSLSCWFLIFVICDTVLVGLARHPSVRLNLLHWFFSADFVLCPLGFSFCLVLFSYFSKFLRWDLKLVTWDFSSKCISLVYAIGAVKVSFSSVLCPTNDTMLNFHLPSVQCSF